MYLITQLPVVRSCRFGPPCCLCDCNGKASVFSMCIPDGSGALCIHFLTICKESVFCQCALSFKLDSIILNTKWNTVWSIQPFGVCQKPPKWLGFSFSIYESEPSLRFVKWSSQSRWVWDFQCFSRFSLHLKPVIILCEFMSYSP